MAPPQAGDLASSLTQEELDMTVEQYLRKQCMERTDALKRHMEGLIENFEGEAKKARVVLRDVASNAEGSSSRADDAEAADTSTENESSGSNAPLAEAFALVCVQGCFAGRVYRFQPSNSQKKWTIGRVEENDVCLSGDDEVSSKHAEITFTPKDKQFKLQDKASTNGTFVSTGLSAAVKLKKKAHTLKLDQVVTFGSCTFKWCYQTTAVSVAESLAKLQSK